MALKSGHGHFQIDSPNRYLPGIINLDPAMAKRLFLQANICPVKILEDAVAPIELASNSSFRQLLISNVADIIDAGHKPLLRCILHNFHIGPHELIFLQELIPHQQFIGACYGRPDWANLTFSSHGLVLVFLAGCPWDKLKRVLPFLGMMNTLQVYKTCSNLYLQLEFLS
jgi:hypothetical protein